MGLRDACAGTFATVVLFYPICAFAQDVAPEIGTNDFCISDMGPDGDTTFGAAIGRTLVAQKAAGLPGFRDEGFKVMVSWLIDLEELEDAMCY